MQPTAAPHPTPPWLSSEDKGAPAAGAAHLEPYKNRVQALHLNDNDSSGDQHQPPFYGTVDWQRMVKILAESSYRGRPLSFELGMRKKPNILAQIDLGRVTAQLCV